MVETFRNLLVKFENKPNKSIVLDVLNLFKNVEEINFYFTTEVKISDLINWVNRKLERGEYLKINKEFQVLQTKLKSFNYFDLELKNNFTLNEFESDFQLHIEKFKNRYYLYFLFIAIIRYYSLLKDSHLKLVKK